MAQLVVTIGPWCSVLAAILLAAMTPGYYESCPRLYADRIGRWAKPG